MFSQQQVNMEVTSLCITQVISVLVLLSAQVHHSYSHRADGTFPRIVPSRLQLFEYESVFINCEGFFDGLIGWRVMRKIKGTTTICSNQWETTGPCNIKAAYPADSGEYWCEAGGKKSNTVNITVTAGSVILESPVLPVMEGEAVTLRCRNKKSSNGTADFYKDGRLINSGSAGELTIHSVSKSDEGLYKCNISGVGESAESWFSVPALGTCRPLHGGFTVLRIFGTILLVALGLALGLYHWSKERGLDLSSIYAIIVQRTGHRQQSTD